MRSPSLKRGALALSLAPLTTILAAPVAAAGQSEEIAEAVSYTHLDVYKRQPLWLVEQ